MTEHELVIVTIVVICAGILLIRKIAKWLDANKPEIKEVKLTPIELSLLNQFLDCGYTEIESGAFSDMVWVLGPGKEEAIFGKSFKLFEWLDSREDIQELIDSSKRSDYER